MRIFKFMLPLAVAAISASASVSVDLNKVWSADLPGNTTGPWGTITFTNYCGTADPTCTQSGATVSGVTVSLEAKNLASGEFISGFYLNLTDNAALPSNLSTTPSTSATAYSAYASTSTGNDAFKADGDGYFDALFSFNTANAANRFTNGEIFTVLITGTGISESISTLRSDADAGKIGYIGAIHLQGITGGCSAWVGDNGGNSGGVATQTACSQVPEPSHAGMLLGVALAGGAYILRRRKTA